MMSLLRHRSLVRQLTIRDVLSRYRGSVLGILWSFLLPLAMLVVYTFVFSVVFQARWGLGQTSSRTDFAITLFCGIVIFNIFSETVSRAPSLVPQNVSFVKKVVFPLEVLPVVALGTALVQAGIGMGILLVAVLVFRGGLSTTLWLLPLVLLPLVALTLGVSWFLASLGVYLRDTAQAVGIGMQILFFITPIFYPITAVPEAFRWVMHMNPLATLVDDARRIVLWSEFPVWDRWALVLAASCVCMLLGYGWFMKTKRGFADVL